MFEDLKTLMYQGSKIKFVKISVTVLVFKLFGRKEVCGG